MSINKQFLKSRPICKVTFRLSKDIVQNAKVVNIVGEFNDWNNSHTFMKKLKNGSFVITVDLETGREYQFRYLINKHTWINDDEADKLVSSGFTGSDNSVIIV